MLHTQVYRVILQTRRRSLRDFKAHYHKQFSLKKMNRRRFWCLVLRRLYMFMSVKPILPCVKWIYIWISLTDDDAGSTWAGIWCLHTKFPTKSSLTALTVSYCDSLLHDSQYNSQQLRSIILTYYNSIIIDFLKNIKRLISWLVGTSKCYRHLSAKSLLYVYCVPHWGVRLV